MNLFGKIFTIHEEKAIPSRDCSFRRMIVGYGKLLGLGALAFLLLLPVGNVVLADDLGQKGDRALKLLTLAPVPPSTANNTAGGMYSFDISFVDQATQTYYLGDRSNKTVDVVDAITGQFTKQINATPPFAGFSGSSATSGPNGVVADFPWLFVTDANSRVVSIDLRTDATVGDVSTGGAPKLRADELAFDEEDGLLLVINNADIPAFGTLISVDKTTGKLTVGKRIIFDAGHGVDATNGAEQPVWDPEIGRFYLSIPQIGTNVANGGVIRINPFSAVVEAIYPVQYCGPAGLTLGPRQDLFIGCNMVFDTAGTVWDPNGAVPANPRDVIIDAKTGSIDANVFSVGAGDEVWFNAGDGNYYATGSGSPQRPFPATARGTTSLGVVDARHQSVLQLVPTYNVPATLTHPAGTSHSVAANARNNHVFVPLPANNAFLSPDMQENCLTGCVAVFGRPRTEDDEH
jgi:hypothetical protein